MVMPTHIILCPRRESNPHVFLHLSLSQACLPIPTQGHSADSRSRTYTIVTSLVSKTSAAASYAIPAYARQDFTCITEALNLDDLISLLASGRIGTRTLVIAVQERGNPAIRYAHIQLLEEQTP
jgi:hypothetical protein